MNEFVKIKAQELSRLVHEVKYMSGDVMSKVKKLHDETVKTCGELTDRSHKLLHEIDEIMSRIEIKDQEKEK